MANSLWKLDKNKSDNLDKKIIASILKTKRIPAIFFAEFDQNIFLMKTKKQREFCKSSLHHLRILFFVFMWLALRIVLTVLCSGNPVFSCFWDYRKLLPVFLLLRYNRRP